MVGKMPGQNTPATTTMATIEQGMKVFTAVYKRVYRSLKSEFKKVYALNATYLNPNQYSAIVDEAVGPDDFNDQDYDVCPGADPNTATQTEKLMKAQGLMELLPAFPGMFDPVKVASRILEAQEQPSYQELFAQQVQATGQYQPPPDPKTQEIQMKSQAEQQKIGMQQQKAEFDSQLKQRDQVFQQIMEKQKAEQDMQIKGMTARFDAAISLHHERSKMVQEAQTHVLDTANAQQEHVQKVVHKEQAHGQAMKQSEEKAKLAQQQAKSSPTGGSKK